MKKKLKGIVVAAATLALAAVMLAGCSGGGDAQKSDEGKAGDAPFTLTVGFDQGYPPYGYVGDDGQFTGFDLELAKAVCEKMGWELKLEPIDWEREGRAHRQRHHQLHLERLHHGEPRERLHVL